MKRDEAVDFIVSELGNQHSQDEIISSLCENLGMPWADAEKFVKQVQAERGQSIAARQSPLLVVMSIVGLIAASIIFILGASYFVNFFLKGYPLSALATDVITTGRYRGTPIWLSSLGEMVIGVVWMAGSIVGMWRTIKSVLNK